jgi:hypothetical protein
MTDNPYSPPKSDIERVERGRCRAESGSVLFVAKDSDLPQRCIKCNGPVTAPPKLKTFYWHASGWYLLILLNLLIYALVAFFVRKKIRVSPALCEAHRTLRRNRVAGSLALFVALFMGGVVSAGNETALISLASFLGSLVCLIVAVISARTIYPIEIHDRGARFKGCGKAFLQSLAREQSL